MNNDTIEVLNELSEGTFPTGSRFICNPPVEDTDNDTVVYVLPENKEKLFEHLEYLGFKSEIYSKYKAMRGDFISYRLGDENLIITWKENFYDKYVHATLIAKRLNILVKEDRIKLFNAVIYETYGDMDFPGKDSLL